MGNNEEKGSCVARAERLSSCRALDEAAVAMTDRYEMDQRHKAAHEAYLRGDLKALQDVLDNPPDFPNCRQPFDLAVGDRPLEYAIYWSPGVFVAELLRLGAD